VAAAEAKLRGQPVDRSAIDDAIAGLRGMPNGDAIDVVVLACTHFPLLSAELGEALGPHVRLVDGAAGIARQIAHLTEGQAFERMAADLAVTTGSRLALDCLAGVLSALGIERTEEI
jgi:glutamate racemase